ncbi:MAG: polyprenyl synthetase family protein [Deltaproteobacteria bacterium]|nr:polyprenyl synthetase family protein [Deltaproteobacteria bacterium]
MDALALLKEVSKRDGINGRILEVLEAAAQLVGNDVDALDEALIRACTDAPSGAFEPCRHIIEAGGKRIRPMLCMLVYRASGGIDPLPMDLAISCELLHSATLLHDDVIDEGEVRRGRPATRVVHGNAISILGGDYLLVKTVEIVSRRGPAFMDFFLKTLRRIISGELVQLKQRGSIGTSEDDYFHIIEGKTASLFQWTAFSGALAAGKQEDLCSQVGRFGWHMGVAFQIVDDVLDFTADATELGKNLLADISEGKMTLPVILAGRVSENMQSVLRNLANAKDPAIVASEVADIVKSTGAIELAREKATEHTNLAIQALESARGLSSDVVGLLKDLAGALLERKT